MSPHTGQKMRFHEPFNPISQTTDLPSRIGQLPCDHSFFLLPGFSRLLRMPPGSPGGPENSPNRFFSRPSAGLPPPGGIGRDGIGCRDAIASTMRSGSTFFLTVRTTKDVPLLGLRTSAKGPQSIHGDFCLGLRLDFRPKGPVLHPARSTGPGTRPGIWI